MRVYGGIDTSTETWSFMVRIMAFKSEDHYNRALGVKFAHEMTSVILVVKILLCPTIEGAICFVEEQ